MCFRSGCPILYLTADRRFGRTGAPRRSKMTKLKLLDPTKTGRPAQDLESKLRRFVVGQEEAIHETVRTYQTHLTDLAPAGPPIGNCLCLGPTVGGKKRVVEAE